MAHQLAHLATSCTAFVETNAVLMSQLLRTPDMSQDRMLPLTNLVVAEPTIVRPEPRIQDVRCRLEGDFPPRILQELHTITNDEEQKYVARGKLLTMNSVYSAGNVQVIRKVTPVEADGTMLLEIHIGDTFKYDQTLVLEPGTIIGCAFSADEPGDTGGQWTSTDLHIIFQSSRHNMFVNFGFRGNEWSDSAIQMRIPRTKEEREKEKNETEMLRR